MRAQFRQQWEDREAKMQVTFRRLKGDLGILRNDHAALKQTARALESERDRLKRQLEASVEEHRRQIVKGARAIEGFLRSRTLQEARETRQRLAKEAFRLGRVVTERIPVQGGVAVPARAPGGAGKNGRGATSTAREVIAETWENGHGFVELETKRRALQVRREDLDRRSKQLRQRRAAAERARRKRLGKGKGKGKTPTASTAATTTAAEAAARAASAATTDEYTFDTMELDLDGKGNSSCSPAKPAAEVAEAARKEDELLFECAEESEELQLLMARLKKDEEALEVAQQKLDAEKALHIAELKRVRDEDRSRFRPCAGLFHQRYLLLSLLGRGGFSEVWRAYDVVKHEEVAVKMHQLNPHWSDAKKMNYTKHATREYNIHRSLAHPRIVRLLDVFEIDINAFATVLEYCRGTDLDRKLKESSALPEREARSILIQIISGLCYLNGRGREKAKTSTGGVRKIIHYDLKPGNILFDSQGCVKITGGCWLNTHIHMLCICFLSCLCRRL